MMLSAIALIALGSVPMPDRDDLLGCAAPWAIRHHRWPLWQGRRWCGWHQTMGPG